MKKYVVLLLCLCTTAAFALDEVKEYGLDKAAAVTTSDTANLPIPARMLWVGGAGNVRIDTVGGSTNITILAVAAGTRLPIQVKKVYATGTTATNIVALY